MTGDGASGEVATARLLDGYFVAQARRPGELRDVDVAALTERQRGLLVHDGTVTRFVEAVALEPVAVDPLDQRDVTVGDRTGEWLELPASASVVRRRIVILGRRTERRYAFAESLLAASRLPAGFADSLARSPRGLGEVLVQARLETRRELLWFGCTDASDWIESAAPLLVRAYRLVVGGRPAILITESFPLDDDARGREQPA